MEEEVDSQSLHTVPGREGGQGCATRVRNGPQVSCPPFPLSEPQMCMHQCPWSCTLAQMQGEAGTAHRAVWAEEGHSPFQCWAWLGGPEPGPWKDWAVVGGAGG